jgi:phosphodiesterase/alkaline phosphatase D-like protein
MLDTDRRVGRVVINSLEPGTKYRLQIGYTDQGFALDNLHWDQAHQLTVQTLSDPPNDYFSFLTGSCRRLDEIFGISLWGKKGDKIFDAMVKNIKIAEASGGKTDFIAFTGDQIYADATPIHACRSFDEYARRYELAFSQIFMRRLLASGIPIYMMRDDHEWWNNADKEEQDGRAKQNQAAQKAYDLFQRPQGKDTPHWWYTTTGDVNVFFMDVRSEREPSQARMISNDQMEALKEWLVREDQQDRIKIIVSSVPMFLLDTDDSWGGYKSQLADLITHIIDNNIKYLMVLSGDAHCENDALFTIYNKEGKAKGQILEVLVSGLFAVSREKAGQLSDRMDLLEHGYYVRANGGLRPTVTKNLFARISGDQRTKNVGIWVYDRNNKLLKEACYDLEKGEKRLTY